MRIYVYIYIAGTFWTRISMKIDYKTGTTVRNTKVRPVFAFVDAVTIPVEKLFLTLLRGMVVRVGTRVSSAI